jgi:hypothetical protein
MEMQSGYFDSKVQKLQAEVLALGSRVDLNRLTFERVAKDNAESVICMKSEVEERLQSL